MESNFVTNEIKNINKYFGIIKNDNIKKIENNDKFIDVEKIILPDIEEEIIEEEPKEVQKDITYLNKEEEIIGIANKFILGNIKPNIKPNVTPKMNFNNFIPEINNQFIAPKLEPKLAVSNQQSNLLNPNYLVYLIPIIPIARIILLSLI